MTHFKRFKSDSDILTQNNNENLENSIIDARFQSYLRFYIADIHNAQVLKLNNISHIESKQNLIKINECILYKLSICGNIVNIFDSEKFYRLKIDDSTGK